MTTPRSLAAIGLLTAGLVVGSTAGAVAGTVITGAQIKDGTVTSADVKDGGLATRDLSAGTVRSLRGLTGYELRYEQTTLPAGTEDSVSASCPSGKRVVGGAAYLTTSSQAVQFAIAFDGRSGVAFAAAQPADDLLRVQIVCAKIS